MIFCHGFLQRLLLSVSLAGRPVPIYLVKHYLDFSVSVFEWDEYLNGGLWVKLFTLPIVGESHPVNQSINRTKDWPSWARSSARRPRLGWSSSPGLQPAGLPCQFWTCTSTIVWDNSLKLINKSLSVSLSHTHACTHTLCCFTGEP